MGTTPNIITIGMDLREEFAIQLMVCPVPLFEKRIVFGVNPLPLRVITFAKQLNIREFTLKKDLRPEDENNIRTMRSQMHFETTYRDLFLGKTPVKLPNLV